MGKSRDANDLLREEGVDVTRDYLGQAPDITDELPPPEPAKPNGHDHNRLILPFKIFEEITAESVAKRWLVKGVFARGETSSCFGPPGGTKSSFWADAAVHISSQEMWRGHRIKENGGVAYFAMERPDLVERRFYAYRIRDGLSGLPIAVIRNTIDMMNQSCVAIIIDTIKAAEDRMRQQIGLAVLDTWAKAIAAGGGDESKPRDQSIVLANIRRVIEKLDIHFATIGHTGKDESRGERGSNAKRADMDLEVQITGGDTKIATIEKANDAPAGRLTAYQLSPVDLGVDSDGDPIQTFIIDKHEPDAAAVSKEKRQQLSSRQKLALKALTEGWARNRRLASSFLLAFVLCQPMPGRKSSIIATSSRHKPPRALCGNSRRLGGPEPDRCSRRSRLECPTMRGVRRCTKLKIGTLYDPRRVGATGCTKVYDPPYRGEYRTRVSDTPAYLPGRSVRSCTKAYETRSFVQGGRYICVQCDSDSQEGRIGNTGDKAPGVTKPNIKITAKQMRFVLDSGKVWMIQPLHVTSGVPDDLRGNYSVPLDEQQKHGWGNLSGKQEVRILRQWVRSGFKL